MSGSEPVGLDEAARRELDVMLQTTLALMPQDAQPEVYERAINELIMDSGKRYGRLAMFEITYTCAVMVTGGELPFRAEAQMQYAGFGPRHDSPDAGTPHEYAVKRFAQAAMHGQRETALRVWHSLTGPDGRLTDEAAQVTAHLMRNAWSRSHNNNLRITLNATKWPPVCDFCCGQTAVVMWDCTGADITLADPRGNGQELTLSMDDVEHWYACRVCKPYLARRRIDWAPVWRRHKANRPNATRADTYVLFKLYETLRHSSLPVPLPDSRPERKGRPRS